MERGEMTMNNGKDLIAKTDEYAIFEHVASIIESRKNNAASYAN